jgi:hypothetical protein
MATSLAAAIGVAGFLVAAAGSAAAQGYVYPGRGQSPEQQQRDMGDCHLWATQQSGANPAAMAPPSAAPQGHMIRGATRGAAIGAVGGAIGGDAGRGAAIGAASGALIGGFRRMDQRRAQEQAYAQASNSYARAYGACLEGRGYTVR